MALIMGKSKLASQRNLYKSYNRASSPRKVLVYEFEEKRLSSFIF